MGRKPYIPTDKDVETVKKLKLKGASDTKCAEALGISRRLFFDLKTAQFAQPIKEAAEERRERILGKAVDALEELLSSEEYEEVTEIEKTYQGVKSTETKTVTKKRTPNATITMFTLVNSDPDNWQSINKVENTTIIDNMPKIEIGWTEPSAKSKS